MQPCSEITIGTSAFHSIVDLTKNTLYSCHTMWHGITVTPHATLNFTGNEIRDAQFANTAIGGVAQAGVPPTKLIAEDNAFLDNHVGVFFPENASKTVAHIPFTGNSFKGTADLLPPCDADLPNYSSTLRGYAGVVTLGSSLTVGTPAASGGQARRQVLARPSCPAPRQTDEFGYSKKYTASCHDIPRGTSRVLAMYHQVCRNKLQCTRKQVPVSSQACG